MTTHSDIRVFRFVHDLIMRRNLEGRSIGPVPIFNDDKVLIGFASIVTQGGAVSAVCAIDPQTPERLNLETSSFPYWLDAELEYRGFDKFLSEPKPPAIVYVRSLILTRNRIPGESEVREGQLA